MSDDYRGEADFLKCTMDVNKFEEAMFYQSTESKNTNNAININPYFPALHLPSCTKMRRGKRDFRCVVFNKGACCILCYLQSFHCSLSNICSNHSIFHKGN